MKRCLPWIAVLVFSQARAEELQLDLGREQLTPVRLVAGAYRESQAGQACPGDGGRAIPGGIPNAIYLVDAATGEPLWLATGASDAADQHPGVPVVYQPDLEAPVAAAVTPVDGDGNGVVDRAYVMDISGTLWRLTLPEPGRLFRGATGDVLETYSIAPVARLGGDERRFVQQADYVRTRDGNGDYDGILVVSGAWPGETGVRNYAYLVKDRLGAVVSHDELPDITDACARRDSAECKGVDLGRGWKLALGGDGELGVSRPLVSRGVVYFTTWLPPLAEDACKPEAGQGLVYALGLADGAPVIPLEEAEPVRSTSTGAGSPGQVLPGGDGLQITGDGDAPKELPAAGGPVRWRIYWREEGVDSL